jgi:hypothetical protein
MAEVHSSIRNGIESRLIGATNTFKTAVYKSVNKPGLYYNIAATGESVPYVVMDILPINPSRDTGTKFYDAIVQFNVSHSTLSNCESVCGYLTDRLEDSEASLTFTGFSIRRIDRKPEIPLGITDNVWNIIIQYGINLEGV